MKKSKRQIPLIMLDADHYYQGKPTPHVCKKCTEVESQRTKIRMAEYYQIEKAAQSGGSREEVIAYEQQVVAEAQAKLSKLITPHKGGEQGTCRSVVSSGRSEGSHNSYGDGGSKTGGGPCPRLHFGNGVYNLTDGSIIVGKYLQPGIVLHSRDIFDRLYDRIEKAIARGTQVQLVIN